MEPEHDLTGVSVKGPPVGHLDLDQPRRALPMAETTRAFATVAAQSFGGPAGQIAVMHRELVERRQWFDDDRFLHALSFCSLLPGPEAQQLATYLGWLLHGTKGGLIAGWLFVLPGFVAIMALSVIYAAYGDTGALTAVFAGITPAVVAIVAQAVLRVGRRSLVTPLALPIAVLSFLALAVFAVPFPLIVIGAGLVGFGAGRVRPTWLQRRTGTGAASPRPASSTGPDSTQHMAPVFIASVVPSWARAARIVGIGVVFWGLPVLAVALVVGQDSILIDQARFFSGSALVTFGGAYAVLSYVAQRAVETYGWLTPAEMVQGLALAETTPGPLIQVVQFVAFVGAFRNPGSLDPWVAALVAATLITWVTYVPSFIFVFVGAPSIEAMRGNRDLTWALSAISAAVVGVMANLGLYFAVHTLFRTTRTRTYGVVEVALPDLSSINPGAVATAVLAAVLVFGRGWSVLRVLAVSAVVGGALHLAG